MRERTPPRADYAVKLGAQLGISGDAFTQLGVWRCWWRSLWFS